ncbi:hypothetical protein NEUTE2DRAFT_147310 [Neurospora tetrasperma FGSC 2509]|nr:hypothetical protein NEUTE2DRAFT_147310 [Neurospora tetrasperma FGSC 2509]
MSSRTTPGPAAKRRRVELANATLRRPFRSPMINRTPPGDKPADYTATKQGKTTKLRAAVGRGDGVVDARAEGEEEDDEETSFSSVSTPAARKASKKSLHYSGASAAGPSTSARRNAKPPILNLSNKQEQGQEPRATRSGINQKRSRIGSGTSFVSSTTSTRPSVGLNHLARGAVVSEAGPDGSDDTLAGLQKSHRETKVHLVTMQIQLDLIRQAKRIEMASRKAAVEESKELRRQDATVIDAELKGLVKKWKLASRQAAEELFELIKGRVADMGGAKAWRETRRRQREGFHSAWDDEGQKGKKRKGDGDIDERPIENSDVSDDEDDDDWRFSQGAGNNDDGDRSAEDNCEDSGFTMLMMLQSLNIEPGVLGYDPNEDKWLD